MTTYKIKDGVRTLEVRGDLLAKSSSEALYKDRWIEFELFRTYENVYVVSRVGKSRIYHSKDCSVVGRNRLSAVDPRTLNDRVYRECEQCSPSFMDMDGVYPEVPRHHAQVSQTAEGVVAYLTQEDQNGSEYLTKVARNLLEEASEIDDDIHDAYMTEVIF